MAFFGKRVFVSDTISFSLAVWFSYALSSKYILSSPKGENHIHHENQRKISYMPLTVNIKTNHGEQFSLWANQSHVLFYLKPPVMAHWAAALDWPSRPRKRHSALFLLNDLEECMIHFVHH